MRALLLILSLLSSLGSAQSLWLELGPAYSEERSEDRSTYQASLKVGVRGLLPVSERNSLYLAPHLYGSSGFGLDSGVWFRFPSDLEDIEGLSSYAGAGLSLSQGRLGLALNAGLSFELSRELALTFTYTHRPLLIPRLSQTFDLSVGVALNVAN